MENLSQKISASLKPVSVTSSSKSSHFGQILDKIIRTQDAIRCESHIPSRTGRPLVSAPSILVEIGVTKRESSVAKR